MPFRIAIAIAYGIFIINAGAVLKVEAINVIEKGAFLIAATLYVTSRPRSNVILWMLGLNCLLIFFLGYFTTYPGFSWGTLIKSLNQIFIVYMLLACVPTEADRDAFLKIAAWLPIASTFLGILYHLAGLRAISGFEYSTGLMRFQGSLIPAFLAGVAMCGTFAAMQFALIKRPFYFGVAGADFLILLLTGGRAALAVTLVVCGVSFYLKPQVSLKLKTIGTVVGLAVGGLMLGAMWESIATRFQSSGANGRDVMWPYLEELASQYPWTGVGFGHQFFTVPREVVILTGSTAAHNDFIRVMVELGYVGVAIFYTLFILAVLWVWRSPHVNKSPIVLIALAGFLFLSRTDNALATPAYFPLIILSVMASVRYPSRTPARAGFPDHLPAVSRRPSVRPIAPLQPSGPAGSASGT
jgi:O-antigen ligase